jgi:DNA-directed RNA polymerase alpha subunit
MSTVLPPDSTPLDMLEFSVRTYHALWNGGARTVGDVRRDGPMGVARYASIGRKALAEIEAVIGTWAPVNDRSPDEPPPPPTALATVQTADLVAELARRFPVAG